MNYQTTVAVTLGGLGVLTGCIDLWLAWQHGHDATISAVIRDAAHRWPIIPFLAGILAGHLFFC